jgi:hypothetical protein
VHVNEAGGDDKAVGPEVNAGRLATESADRRDPVIPNSEVCGAGGFSAAVNDPPPLNDQLEHDGSASFVPAREAEVKSYPQLTHILWIMLISPTRCCGFSTILPASRPLTVPILSSKVWGDKADSNGEGGAE